MSGAAVRLYRTAAALAGWLAVGLQYYTLVHDKTGAAFTSETIFFVSFFTIWTNVLVATAMTFTGLAPLSRPGRFFDRPGVRTALCVYIIIVAVIYHWLLSDLWNPKGLQLFADRLLHTAVPILFVLDWLIIVPKGRLSFAAVPLWLVIPLIYMAYTLVRGAAVAEYPYPFIDVVRLGYPTVILNIVGLSGVFIGVGVLLIVIDRKLGLIQRADH